MTDEQTTPAPEPTPPPPVEPEPEPISSPEPLAPEFDSAVPVGIGFNIDEVLRNESQNIAVSYDLLVDPGVHISQAHFGYLEFGGGLYYRPTGFDLDTGAVICTRVTI